MKDFIERFTGRKFLLALSGFIGFVAAGEYGAAAAVLLGFLGVEGAADAFVRKADAEAHAFLKATQPDH